MSGWTANPGFGIALYDFAGDGPAQLSLKEGDEVEVKMEHAGWYRGHKKGDTSGALFIFPVAYVDFTPGRGSIPPAPAPRVSPSPSAESTKKSISQNETPVVVERQSVSVEPKPIKREPTPLATMYTPAIKLNTTKLNDGNNKDGFIIPEGPDKSTYDTENAGVVELLDVHRIIDPITATDNIFEVSSTPNSALEQIRLTQHQIYEQDNSFPSNATSPTGAPIISRVGITSTSVAPSHNSQYGFSSFSSGYSSGACTVPPRKFQLFLDVKVCIFSVGEDTDIYFSLYSRTKDKFIADNFVLALPPSGHPKNSLVLNRMKTVFRDISAADLKDDLYLVCRIYRNGNLIFDAKESSNNYKPSSIGITTRRAFGCAVTSISDAALLFDKIGTEYQPPPASLMICTPSVETNFPNFHKTLIDASKGLIKEKDKDYEPAPRAKGIALGLTLFEGELEDVKATCPSFTPVYETPCIGFAPIWNPNVPRNDVYVRLLGGSFLQDKKSSARNIEVRVTLRRNSDYSDVVNALTYGSGTETFTTYTSTVYYHTNTPIFEEHFCISNPTVNFDECHLYFEFWHVSTTAKKSAIFSNAYMYLTGDNGRFVADGEHQVTSYKPWGKSDKYLTEETKSTPRAEYLNISTQLASTTITQNSTLTIVNNWKNLSNVALLSAMQQLMVRANVPQTSQLAHNFKQLCNAMLSILANSAYSDVHLVAFQCLVHIFARLAPEYTPVLEKYVQSATEGDAFPKLLVLLTQSTNSTLSTTTNTTKESKENDKNLATRKSVPAGSATLDETSPTYSRTVSSTTLLRLQSSNNEDDSDDVITVRHIKALPLLLQLVVSLFLVKEEETGGTNNHVVSQVTPAASNPGFRAPPPVTGGAVSLPLDVSRALFIENFDTILDTVRDFLNLRSDFEKSRHTAIAQSIFLRAYPSLTAFLSNKLYTVEESNKQIELTLNSISPSASVSVDKLAVIKSILTGVSGPVHPPSDSLVAFCGKDSSLTVPLTSWARAWSVAPRHYKSKAATAEHLTNLIPIFVTHISQTLNDAVERNSLAEAYMSGIILQHLYTLIHSNTFDNTIYCNFYQNKGLVTSFESLLPVLPAVINMVHQIFCSHPNIPLLKHEIAERPQLTVPPQWLLQQGFIDLLQDYTTLILGMLDSVNEEQLQTFIRSLPCDVRRDFLRKTLSFCNSLLTVPIYPNSWIIMNMFLYRVVVGFTLVVAPILKSDYSGDNFCRSVWCHWLQLAIDFMQCSALDVDDMIMVKRVIVNQYGDIRKSVAAIFPEMWTFLSSQNKVDTSFLLVDTLLKTIAYENKPEFVDKSFNLYFDLLVAQFDIAKDFAEIERYSIDSLYEITNDNGEIGTIVMEKLYKATMKRFDEQGNDTMKAAGAEFLDHMRTLFSLMSSLFSFPDEPQYEDDRTSIALRLISYIERTGHSASTRKAMHSRYVQYLVDLHANSNNHIEAGISQLQQAKMLDWSDTVLDAFAGYPVESERERKERLIRNSILSFVKGNDWERAVDRSDYLRNYYQHAVFNYEALSEILADEAVYFSKIVHAERFYSNYFRVCFFGKFDDETLTPTVENGIPFGEYIYKGNQLEPVMDFTNRIKKRFSDVYFHMSGDRPSADLFATHPRIISVTIMKIPDVSSRKEILDLYCKNNNISVESLSINNHNQFEQWNNENKLKPQITSTPSHITKYQDNDNISVFEYSRPWRRLAPGAAPSNNEFKDLWLVRTCCIVSESFPSNRRRIPVIGKYEVQIQPIVNAIDAVEKKTQDLEKIVNSVREQRGLRVDVGPLSMILNGMIDAAVNGGIAKFLEIFLTPEFTTPESVVFEDELRDIEGTLATRRALQEDLKSALRNQISALEIGLGVFGERADKLVGLFEHLQVNLNTMIQDNKDVLDLN